MMFPPAALLRDLHRPPATRPVYDVPPIITYRPGYRPFRALAALLAATRSHTGFPPGRPPTRTEASGDQLLT